MKIFVTNCELWVILTGILISMSHSECPPDSITKPCRCEKITLYKNIICNFSQDHNIAQITKRIDQYNLREVDKRYYKLDLSYPKDSVVTLEKNAFHGLTFEKVFVYSGGSVKIHKNAFNSSILTLQSLLININKLVVDSPAYDIYNLVNSMPNLLNLTFKRVTSTNNLPPNKLNSSSLHSIEILYMTKFRNKGFSLLGNIEKIQISGAFDYIPSEAFVVDKYDTTKALNISIQDSLIKGSSFGSGVFTNTERTLHLVFKNNQFLKYLDKKIFRPLFQNYPNSTVEFIDNELDCHDCNFKWIEGKFQSKIVGVKCKNASLLIDFMTEDNNKNTTCHHKEGKDVIRVVLFCISGLALTCIILTILLIFVMKRKIKTKRKDLIKDLKERNKLKERTSLSLGKSLGDGQYGCVYQSLFEDKSSSFEVAVKTMKKGSDKKSVEYFFKEGIDIINFEHERILTPIGICFDENDYPMIILPLMPNGDLLKFLRRKDVVLTSQQLFEFAQQIAEGMVYLSSMNFVHRDLAARNILLDENLCPKIGDFGLSRNLYSKHYYRSKNKIPLPYKWMAPECIEKGFYNSQTDVWSFGVLFWEIMNRGSDPYPTIQNANILQYIKSGGRLPDCPSYCPHFFSTLLRQCWYIEADFRPTFAYIAQFIHINKINHATVQSCDNTSDEPYFIAAHN